MKAFGQYHPFVLMTYFLSILLLTMFVWNPVLQAEALIAGILFCIMLLKRGSLAGELAFYIPMFLLIAITNPLFSHNGVTPLFFLNGNPVTLEALLYGVSIAVAVISVMLWCKCYNEIMTSDKFLYLCGKAIPKLSLVLSMALRFIPMFKRQMKRVSNAQKTMGLYSSKSYTDRLRGSMRVFMAMLSWSFENAMDTAASMQARGYGLKGRTNFSMFHFSARDGIMLGAGLFAAVWTLAGAAASSVSFSFYPRITPVPHSLFAISVYILFAVLVFLPFMIEGKESVKWRYYISKI